MATIFVKRKVRIPTIATWKWKRNNYQLPLVFQLPGARCSLFLDPSEAGWRDRHVLWEAYILLEFPSAHKILVDGLKSSGKVAGQAAEMIYGLYIQVYEQFESVLRTAGNVIYLMQDRPMSFDEFFHEDTLLGEGIQWWGDGIEPKQFRPKVTRNRRRINPLFKHDQIMTLQKWKGSCWIPGSYWTNNSISECSKALPRFLTL